MSDNSDRRKKALIVSVLTFLLAGGGIFLYFIVQGSNDLTGKGKKSRFSYGFAVRDTVAPLFKRMGITTYEDDLVEATKQRLEARGIDLSPDVSAAVDLSDWMSKEGGSAAASSGRGSSSSRPATPTSVPKMSHKSMGATSGGGGGSKSAGSTTRFGGGSASGTTSVTGKAQAGASGTTDKGTLGTLKNAKNLLGEGLRSNSAMTAQNKWGQSFGVGKSGKSGDLAYNKAGLVGLDKIKSGEIADLKMDKASTLKTTEVSSPVKDVDGTKAALDGDKKFKGDMEDKIKADAAKQALQAAADAVTKDEKPKSDGKSGSSDGDTPPKNVQDMALAGVDEGGKMCSAGCETAGGSKYSDKNVGFQKDPNNEGNWIVTYNGSQTMPDGSVIYYSDSMSLNPANGSFTPLSSMAGPSADSMSAVPFGGT